MAKTSKGILLLRDLWLEDNRRKHPKYPEAHRLALMPYYTDATANGLTKCIIDYLRFTGHQAERISSSGRVIDTRKKYTDAVGFNRQIGSVTWIKGSGTRGTADISATIRGRAVKIEVKIDKDRQSAAQKEYQRQIESAGGVYLIAKTLDGFLADLGEI